MVHLTLFIFNPVLLNNVTSSLSDSRVEGDEILSPTQSNILEVLSMNLSLLLDSLQYILITEVTFAFRNHARSRTVLRI